MRPSFFQITPSGNVPLDLPGSTLDEITSSLPDGVYTTFSTIDKGAKVLGLTQHLNRLYIPAVERGINPAVPREELRKRISESVYKNLPDESRIRLILLYETGEIFIGAQKFESQPVTVYDDGVRVVTISSLSRNRPTIKGTNFITNSKEERNTLLKSGNVYEALLTHRGKILEGMTSNFYVVIYKPNVAIVTARRGILPGVTRRAILQIARANGINIEYRAPGIDEKFDEAFLTSSSRGVVPIVKINESIVGNGQVGEVTKKISEKYKAYLLQKAETI